jgi:hypothetical protein
VNSYEIRVLVAILLPGCGDHRTSILHVEGGLKKPEYLKLFCKIDSMMDIIVSHYNCLEFEPFLEFLTANVGTDTRVLIYDKSGKYTKTQPEHTVVRLENVGREGETYLNHIISNYDSLNEYTLFIQDDTEQHIPNYMAFTDACKEAMEDTQFKLFACSWRKGGAPHSREIIDGMCGLHTFSSKDAIKRACELHGIHLPARYVTPVSAFFICHRDRIRARPLKFYVDLREWLLQSEKNGFVLEHLWKIIFE